MFIVVITWQRLAPGKETVFGIEGEPHVSLVTDGQKCMDDNDIERAFWNMRIVKVF